MSKDFEGYELELPAAKLVGKPVDLGGQDPSGAWPSRSIPIKPRPPRRARGSVPSSEIPLSTSEIVSSPEISRISDPLFLIRKVTKMGHVIEIDDTPGFERILFRHTKGSSVEIIPDGSMTVETEGNLSLDSGEDFSLVARGSVTIIAESNAEIRVKGDLNVTVDGDQNTLVRGNSRTEILGSESRIVRENLTSAISGSETTEVRGDSVRRNLSNRNEWTTENYTHEIGGTSKRTVEGSIIETSWGPIEASYHGGIVTLDGANEEGTLGNGLLVSTDGIIATLNSESVITETLDVEDESKIGGDLNVEGSGIFGGTVHTPSLEGTAKRAEWAQTAGSAPTGASVPKTASPNSPNSPTDPVFEWVYDNEVTKVSGDASTEFIENLDRSEVTGFGNRVLSLGEFNVRARNTSLRQNETWVQDHIDAGIILDSIGTVPPIREELLPSSTLQKGSRPLGRTGTDASFQRSARKLKSIPSAFLEPLNLGRRTLVSPSFRLSQVLGGDSLTASLISQGGLSAQEIFRNLVTLSFNVLEPLKGEFGYSWVIADCLYNLLPNETIFAGTVPEASIQGLAVGIQFPNASKEAYTRAAEWASAELPLDRTVLSFFDYDPRNINEPTLILTLSSNPRGLRETAFNHQIVSEGFINV